MNAVVHLKDGRVIDLSGRTPHEAIDYLKSLGVKSPAEIEKTVHRVSSHELATSARRRP